MKTLIVLTAIYFAINLLLTGYYAGKKDLFKDTRSENIKEFFACIILIFLTIPFCLITVIKEFIISVKRLLQIKFLFNTYFTNKYNNLTEERLSFLNTSSRLYNYKVVNHCINVINKRNNYSFVPKTETV
jgi:hypothetical protein